MTTKPSSRQHPRVSRLYRSGTFIFVGISLLVGAAIALISFSRTTIVVTLGPREVRETVELTISEQPTAGSSDLHGKLLFETIEGNVSSSVPTSGAVVEDYARGLVTIYNQWTKPQPLAATTRLRASLSGLIFRTTKRVDVPAGGSVVAEVVADKKGAAGNIPPDRFEIVALWSGLKDQIYGQSNQAMTGGTRSEAAVTQALLDDAREDLERELLAKLKTTAPPVPDGMTVVGDPKLVTSSLTSNATPGEVVPSFVTAGSVRTLLVAVETEEMTKKIAAVLETTLTEDEAVTGSSTQTTWRVLTLNESRGTANLELTVAATVQLKPESDHLAVEKFTRKTRAEILQTLLGTPGVKSADVRMSPFWATRSPSLPSQIMVRVTVQPSSP